MSPRGILARLTASENPGIGEPRPARLIDACIESYIEWREECEHLEGAYSRWAASGAPERNLAFPAYRAALDREEKAALVYEFMIERVARRARR